MRVLVLSDTHIPTAAKKLPAIIEHEARQSDYCLHSGDFTVYEVFEQLTSWTETYGVCGNMDDARIKKALPHKQILHWEGVNIGLIHGGGHPSQLDQYVRREFAREYADISLFVFGHSHNVCDREQDGKIYFNPGSPTDTIFAPYRSFGILDIHKGVVKRKVVKIE